MGKEAVQSQNVWIDLVIAWDGKFRAMQWVFFSFNHFLDSFDFNLFLPGFSIPFCSWHNMTQLVVQSLTDCSLSQIKGSVLQQHCRTPKSAPENTCFPLSFTWIAHITTSSQSLVILSMEYGRIFPLPPLLQLQHKPSRGNNKQMREMGTVPSENSQVLWQPSITTLVPRLKSRRQAWAWLPQSWSRTGKTWQKSPLPVTFIPTLPATHSHPSTSLDTETVEQRVIFTTKLSVRIRPSASCITGCLETRTSQWLGARAVWEELCSQLDNLGQ